MRKLFRLSATVFTVVVLGLVIWVLVIRAIAFRYELSEKAALRQVAAVQSAQEAYSSYNDGYYGDLECLVDPKQCLNGAQPLYLQRFLEPAQADIGVKDGYRFFFVPGPVPRNWTRDEWKKYVERTRHIRYTKGLPPVDKRHVPDAYIDFAYVAVPISDEGAQNGFCADGSGFVWPYQPYELDELERPLEQQWSETLSKGRYIGVHLCPLSLAHQACP